ncbi:MAG: FecR domain-containing protein [Bdellovibrionota bacterium]
MKFLIFFLFTISLTHAQVGEVLSMKGSHDAWISRNGSRISIAEGLSLETGDNIHTENAHVTFLIYPKIQMSLVKGTEITISRHMIEESTAEKSTSLIELIKGLIRVQVTKDGTEEVDHKIDARGVTFSVRGTEFEVSSTDEDAELDVFEGEVEVSSPYVQTFVPEIVKPNEGFRFERKEKKFARRALKERNREARFIRKEEMRQRWKNKKASRIEKRQSRVERKRERKERKGRGR